MSVRPENEEPEGPDLPHKKTKSVSIEDAEEQYESIIEVRANKYTEIKGAIGATAAAMILISYILYYYYYYNNGIKLNELYFVSSGVGISIFTGLLFTFFKNIYVRTALLFTSVFYLILEIAYVVVWLLLGKPYAHIKFSLIIGLIIGIIYFIYDKLKYQPSSSNKQYPITY